MKNKINTLPDSFKSTLRTVNCIWCLMLLICMDAYAQSGKQVKHDTKAKTILLTDGSGKLSLLVDYSNGCRITQLNVKGNNTLSASGAYTALRPGNEQSTSGDSGEAVKIVETKDGITISNILLVNNDIKETWTFKPSKNSINWTIHRMYTDDIRLEDMSFPVWNFVDLSVWKGGIFDNGGMVWCKYFRKNDTFGVHTAGVTFWNPDTDNALKITPATGTNKHLAAKYTNTEAGEFACTQYVTDTELKQRYQQNRFVGGHTDVFAPFLINKGETTVSLDLQCIDYATVYSRGTLPGIDAVAVRELLNTTGRYGVVDNNIIGANGWITNWKCLHEPFFAQIGMAVADMNYTRNFSATLNQERDLAMQDDGRVLSRWHGVRGDEIPGTYNAETGYYEAMWGYTIDSQTGYIINAAEQFNLCGDITWLRSHKESCEKALDWLIRRDSNNNGIFEMKNNNIGEKKASDWVDIVWASFENAFVNAQMYEALNLWANCERILGDHAKALYYLRVAARLKDSFNQPVDQGGFWLPEKSQYIYWRDKDGSTHGDNLVTPVNFAVIAFGLCDDPQRVAQILDQIEQRTTAEKLFHWPLCFDSFKREEVHNNNWPFPRYENGDIFPTWGYLGVRAYVGYNKEIALKYIRNILDQYNKDGLSSQRYSRTTQLGLGTDILAGISTTVTALYRDIYGVRPKWNRMGLEPNMLPELNGTDFQYVLRDTVYNIKLSVGNYQISTEGYTVKSGKAFGVSTKDKALVCYPFNKEEMTLRIVPKSKRKIDAEIGQWASGNYSWTISSDDSYTFTLAGLDGDKAYELLVNNKKTPLVVGKDGKAFLSATCKGSTTFKIQIK